MRASRRSRAHNHPATGGAAARTPAAGRPLILPLAIALVLLGITLAAWRMLSPTVASAPSMAAKGPVAPAIDVPTVDGGHFSLAAQRGNPVILFFMTTDCSGCEDETRALGRLSRADTTGKLAILMVAMTPQSDTPAAIRAYRARNQGPDRFWAVDQGGAITRAYGITALTSTVLIDRGGHVAGRHISDSLDLATLQAAVRPLL